MKGDHMNRESIYEFLDNLKDINEGKNDAKLEIIMNFFENLKIIINGK
jgi:hypothetical protein